MSPEHGYRAPRECPICSEQLHITRLGCAQCGTGLTGAFAGCDFCDLDDAQDLARPLRNADPGVEQIVRCQRKLGSAGRQKRCITWQTAALLQPLQHHQSHCGQQHCFLTRMTKRGVMKRWAR